MTHLVNRRVAVKLGQYKVKRTARSRRIDAEGRLWLDLR